MSTEEQAEGEETRDEATTNGLSEDIDDEQFTATEPDEPSVADPVTTEDIAPEADLAVTGGLDEKTQEAPEAPNAEDMLNAFPYREQALGETTPERAHSLPPSPSFSPPRYESIGESDRRAIHSKLRAYENRRRMAYTTKLESSSLYWRSFRELLSASVHETARAERMVLGTAMANKAYAESMQASYDDVFLDDRGAIVNDLKKQKKLLDIRSIQAYDVAPIGKTEEGKRFTVKVPEERKSNMLHTLIESQLEISSKFGENAETLGAEIATEISDLRKALAAKVTEINLIGDTIIGELEKTETEVSDAWEAYFATATKSMGGSSFSTSMQRRAGASDHLPKNEEKEFVDDCLDVWVVEMHYRVAVAYQSSAWEKGSAELSKLFASMKETECSRRSDLREFLVAFCQRQERLFTSLPEIHSPVLQDLVGRPMDSDTVEVAVQAAIKKKAQQLQKEDSKKPGRQTPPSLQGAESTDDSFSLDSPLMSELICKSKVVEVRTSGLMGNFKFVLAIVTADSFLHLFDVPPGRLSSGSAPEVAFQALVPKAQIPTKETVKSGKTNFLKGWCDHLAPTDSFILTNCTLLYSTKKDSTAFQIEETLHSQGAAKMFGKTTSRKVTLRTVSKRETDDLVAALKAQK